VALSGLAAFAGASRAQYNGDPGLDPRVAQYIPPQVHVAFQCDAQTTTGVADSPPNLWAGGVVPLVIDSTVLDPVLTVRALDIWMFRAGPTPNVTFIKRDPNNPAHDNYVLVTGIDGPVSSSQVGNLMSGVQSVKQGSEVNDYVMAHEFCHTLGFWHEHTRPDRDAYVTVYYDRVYPSTAQPNFDIAPEWVPRSRNTGYDFDSVMHYGATSFMNPGCPFGTCLAVATCTPLVANFPAYTAFQCTMGQQDHLSTNDVQDMINVYGQRPRTLSFIGPNVNFGSGTLSDPYQYPPGGGGDVYFEGGSTYHVTAGTTFTSAATWRKHSDGVARITAP
jgi:hypothetical protein